MNDIQDQPDTEFRYLSQESFSLVDDFIFAGSPTSSHRSVAMATAEHVCTDLGVTIEIEKMREGPATILSVFGTVFHGDASPSLHKTHSSETTGVNMAGQIVVLKA